ncbi:hypothetical protein ES703_121040 [subsurface metagenome]
MLVLSFSLVTAVPVVAAPPEEISIDVIQSQTRYYPDGSWMHDVNPFQTTFELTLTGKVLHGEMSYSPDVTDLRGEKYFLVYDKKADEWKLNLGVIQYTSPYTGLTIKEHWEGFLKLDADFNIIQGEFTQHAYVAGDATAYSWAVPVAGKGLWYLGFSVYTYTPVP